MIDAGRAFLWLVRAWWLIFPCFGALTVTLVIQRTCARPHQLLPSVTSDPALAWPVALLYLSAHLWMLAAYLLTVERAGSLLPTPQAIRAVWSKQATKLMLMTATLVVEASPVALLRLAGDLICGRLQ